MSNYLCLNGHLVKHSYQAGLECAQCKRNRTRKESKPVKQNKQFLVIEAPRVGRNGLYTFVAVIRAKDKAEALRAYAANNQPHEAYRKPRAFDLSKTGQYFSVKV